MEGQDANNKERSAFRNMEKVFRHPPLPAGSAKKREKITQRQKIEFEALCDSMAIEVGNPVRGGSVWEEVQRTSSGCVLYRLKSMDGLWVIQNALSYAEQRQILSLCFTEWWQPPQHTNLFPSPLISPTSIDHHSDASEDESVVDPTEIVESKSSGMSMVVESDCDGCASGTPLEFGSQRFTKLRWSSLGYPYDWTSRKYVRTGAPAMPSQLLELCSKLQQIVPCPLQPQAALVNYYHACQFSCISLGFFVVMS
eukprot:c9524_g1_i1.p1 GENE.c9524_g1_i1~~c9524_g1_i1.p1  ORF type:complete len:254 (-),score=50.46 c9524_g1_i1:40-801(-)